MIGLMQQSKPHKLFLLLALLLIGHAATAATEKQPDYRALQALGDCLKSLESNPGELVEIACPRLRNLFENPDIASRIDMPLLSDATPASIHDLQGIFEDFSATVSPSQFDFKGLNELLAKTLVVQGEKAKTLWERFVDWLKQQQPGNNTDWEWLQKLLRDLQLPEWFGTWLLRGTIALTLLLALGIIVIEIRASEQFRLFRKRTKSDVNSKTRAAHLQQKSSPNRQQIAMLPLAQQPAALLNWIISELVSRNLLPDNRSLTNGEYCVAIHRRNAQAALGFSELMGFIDKTIYGNRLIDSNAMQNLFSQTDDVLRDCLRIEIVARKSHFE